MYSAKSVEKKIENGVLHVTVEFTDDAGKPAFQETFWANSGTDPYWLQNRVKNKLHELNTLVELHDNFQLGDIPNEYGMPKPQEGQIWAQEVFALKQMKKAVELGLMEETDPEFKAAKKRLKDGFKKNYISTVQLI